MAAPAPFNNTPKVTVLAASPWPARCDNVTFASTPQYGVHFSLIFVFDRAAKKLLLGTKKRGFGCGIVNGYGGKLDIGESMDACAVRELREESGLTVEPQHMTRRGRLIFTFAHPTQTRDVCDITLYTAERWTGDPQETEEMSPCWYPIDDLPLNEMWPDFRIYFPHLLELIWHDRTCQLLSRIDYDYVAIGHASPVPSLQSLGIHDKKRTGKRSEAGQKVEAVVGYWMGLAAC